MGATRRILLIGFVLQILLRDSIAKPLDLTPSDVNNIDNPTKDALSAYENLERLTKREVQESGDPEGGDDLEASETMVFRPLFRYKNQSVQKKRVYDEPPKAPAPSRAIPDRFVYDSKTHAYVPEYGNNSPTVPAHSGPQKYIYDKNTRTYIPESFHY